jgi:hypothetical protein
MYISPLSECHRLALIIENKSGIFSTLG